jgi:hypothetical protein
VVYFPKSPNELDDMHDRKRHDENDDACSQTIELQKMRGVPTIRNTGRIGLF